MSVTTIPPDESTFGNKVTIEKCQTKEVITFYGGCHALRLCYRGITDSHICYEILTEDDGNWFLSRNGASSFWLPEMLELFKTADKWLKTNAEPDLYNGVQYGYKEFT